MSADELERLAARALIDPRRDDRGCADPGRPPRRSRGARSPVARPAADGGARRAHRRRPDRSDRRARPRVGRAPRRCASTAHAASGRSRPTVRSTRSQRRARETGIAAAALRRTHHLGMLAPYAERSERAGADRHRAVLDRGPRASVGWCGRAPGHESARHRRARRRRRPHPRHVDGCRLGRQDPRLSREGPADPRRLGRRPRRVGRRRMPRPRPRVRSRPSAVRRDMPSGSRSARWSGR